MPAPAIQVENLSKQFRLGLTHSGSLRELINRNYRKLFRRRATAPLAGLDDAVQTTNNGDSQEGTFWALRDVSFEVQTGEVIGIIGKNGAGKSTLLKILSRITKPTSGRAILRGRVASLLEVGTGFHPELTGRENVYLNGTILGMTKSEVNHRFDEIVDFSGVEKFIDTPVKRYSSGMIVRLGFAVAAHLEPEILIVDEVLAVGDVEFQQRCLSRMQQITSDGKTIVFVSHNMEAVQSLCSSGVLLHDGVQSCRGPIVETVENYLARNRQTSTTEEAVTGDDYIVHRVTWEHPRGGTLLPDAPAVVSVDFTPLRHVSEPGLYVGILTRDGHRLTGVDLRNFQSLPSLSKGKRTQIRFEFESFPLLPGDYSTEIHLKDMLYQEIEQIEARFPFRVETAPIYGARKLDHWFGSIVLRPKSIDCQNIEARPSSTTS